MIELQKIIQEDYYGSRGAGILFLARDTKRFLFGLRSSRVREPGTWGIFGGKVDPGEDPKFAAEREAYEETGYTGPMDMTLLHTYKDGEFRYFTYLAVVPGEFEPNLDWENSDYRWVSFGDWPKPIHFGTAEVLDKISQKIDSKDSLLEIKFPLKSNPKISVEDRREAARLLYKFYKDRKTLPWLFAHSWKLERVSRGSLDGNRFAFRYTARKGKKMEKEPYPGAGYTRDRKVFRSPKDAVDYVVASQHGEKYEDEFVFRGMNMQEWIAAKKQGYIKSETAYNIGDVEWTYYGKKWATAHSYASGFAPWDKEPTRNFPGVIVAVPSELVVSASEKTGQRQDDEFLQEKIPIDKVIGIWYIIPIEVGQGYFELVQRPDSTGTHSYLDRGSASPTMIKSVVLPVYGIAKGEKPNLQESVKGDCFNNARKFASKHESEGAVVVHGKVTDSHGKTFDHAWVEIKDKVHDPTTGAELNKERWYELLNAVPEAKYTPHQANINMVRSGNLGPWTPKERGDRFLKELEYPLASDNKQQTYRGYKGWKGKLVWMHPEKFLHLAHPLADHHMNQASYRNLKYRMKRKLPLDFLVLSVDPDKKKVVGHEGRHRAKTAKELGIEKVPVLVLITKDDYPRVPKWGEREHEFADKAEFDPQWVKEVKVELTEGEWIDKIDKKISDLEKEWEKLDSTGTGHSRQIQIQKELEKLSAEKNRWIGIHKSIEKEPNRGFVVSPKVIK